MGRKRNNQAIPDEPTDSLVRKYINEFVGNSRFMIGDGAILSLVKLFPENSTFHEVLAKVCVINDLYATGITATYDMANHIVVLEVDQALSLAGADIVDKIAWVSIGGKKRHNYSFASKYCAWHRPEHYPMFDDYVRQIFLAYRDKDNFATFEDADLRQYPLFKQIVNAFQSQYRLSGYSYRELDYFLWGYGKKLFPKQYKKITEQVAPPDRR